MSQESGTFSSDEELVEAVSPNIRPRRGPVVVDSEPTVEILYQNPKGDKIYEDSDDEVELFEELRAVINLQPIDDDEEEAGHEADRRNAVLQIRPFRPMGNMTPEGVSARPVRSSGHEELAQERARLLHILLSDEEPMVPRRMLQTIPAEGMVSAMGGEAKKYASQDRFTSGAPQELLLEDDTTASSKEIQYVSPEQEVSQESIQRPIISDEDRQKLISEVLKSTVTVHRSHEIALPSPATSDSQSTSQMSDMIVQIPGKKSVARERDKDKSPRGRRSEEMTTMKYRYYEKVLKIESSEIRNFMMEEESFEQFVPTEYEEEEFSLDGTSFQEQRSLVIETEQREMDVELKELEQRYTMAKKRKLKYKTLGMTPEKIDASLISTLKGKRGTYKPPTIFAFSESELSDSLSASETLDGSNRTFEPKLVFGEAKVSSIATHATRKDVVPHFKLSLNDQVTRVRYLDDDDDDSTSDDEEKKSEPDLENEANYIDAKLNAGVRTLWTVHEKRPSIRPNLDVEVQSFMHYIKRKDTLSCVTNEHLLTDTGEEIKPAVGAVRRMAVQIKEPEKKKPKKSKRITLQTDNELYLKATESGDFKCCIYEEYTDEDDIEVMMKVLLYNILIDAFYIRDLLHQTYEEIDLSPFVCSCANASRTLEGCGFQKTHIPCLEHLQYNEIDRFIVYPMRVKERLVCFPVQSFLPHIKISHDVPLTHISKVIAMERLKLLFKSTLPQTCMAEAGIRERQAIPVEYVRTEIIGDDEDFSEPCNFLPLQYFDDDEFDDLTPEGWMEYGALDGVQLQLPAEAYIPLEETEIEMLELVYTSLDNINRYRWRRVAVVDYDAVEELFLVYCLDKTDREFRIPRIYICFACESPWKYVRRLSKAIRRRESFELKMRYQFKLDCMALDSIPGMPERLKRKIEPIATDQGRMRYLGQASLKEMTDAASFAYKETMLEQEFIWRVVKHADMKNRVVIPKMRFDVDYWRKPPVYIKYHKRSEMNHGGSRVIRAYRPKLRDYLNWHNVFVEAEISWAIYSLAYECIFHDKRPMYRTKQVGFMTINEFEFRQLESLRVLFDYINFTWVPTITSQLQTKLDESPKGWYNYRVRNHGIYKMSKLRRLFKVVRLRMQGALRDVIYHSIVKYADHMTTPCKLCVHVEDTFVWGPELGESPFEPRIAPMFELLLRMTPTGPEYSTDPDLFLPLIISIYDESTTRAHMICQVGPLLLRNLALVKSIKLCPVGSLEAPIVANRLRIVTSFEKTIVILKAYILEYVKFTDLYPITLYKFNNSYRNKHHTIPEIKAELDFNRKLLDELVNIVPSSIVIGPFHVNVDEFRASFIKQRTGIFNSLIDFFCLTMNRAVEAISAEYEGINHELTRKPKCIEEIHEIRTYINNTMGLHMRTLEAKSKRLMLEYEMLQCYSHIIPDTDFVGKWDMKSWPGKIEAQVKRVNLMMDQMSIKFYVEQLADGDLLLTKIEICRGEIEACMELEDPEKLKDNALVAQNTWKSLESCVELGLLLNRRQKLFKVPLVAYPEINKLVKLFEPYRHLWITASDWLKCKKRWTLGPFMRLSINIVERITTGMTRVITKCIKMLGVRPVLQEIAIQVRTQIDDFRPKINLMQAMLCPALKSRHMVEFQQKTGLSLNFNKVVTFNELYAAGFGDWAEELILLSKRAVGELVIKKAIRKVNSEWEAMGLTIQQQNDTMVLKDWDELIPDFDDQILRIQQLLFSPYKKYFDQYLNRLYTISLRMRTILTKWSEIQKKYLVLRPIFLNEDVAIQIPVEAKIFEGVNRSWRVTMKNAAKHPMVLNSCNNTRLIRTFNDCASDIEIVEKSVADYMEKKRVYFPRLYFLSDDELIELISQARDPKLVQAHLKKCFENICKLEFESDMKVIKMISEEGEWVELTVPFYPRGWVEHWLVLLESTMKQTMRAKLLDSVARYYETTFKKWAMSWPAQIVLAVWLIFWTASVHVAIQKRALRQCASEIWSQLNEMQSLLLTNVTSLQREVISCLIIIQVHAKDIVNTLAVAPVEDDFEWLKQLRYYVSEGILEIKAMNNICQYGYEYLGDTGRLVITPLTDRCYLTLMGAINLHFGGSLAGPAGTGKTETTKDLAKCLAIQCVVFNCSDQLDHMAMAKFFKGVASSGAWACFDEFNRIDIEVLSVVAQQLTTIQKAKQSRVTRFVFDGKEMSLNPTCAVFITMNPGYAGRTELPDNLKSLFRPVSMMMSNYTAIAEVSLLSIGFITATELAQKITLAFKFSSEQLSAQDHYDFGMRAVKAVIATAKNLSVENQAMPEAHVVYRALRQVNEAKFLSKDILLFDGILKDLFPEVLMESIDYTYLKDAIAEGCMHEQIQPVPEFVKKVIQLYETILVRHGLMLVGPAGSGKTRNCEVLRKALNILCEYDDPLVPKDRFLDKVETYILNPKSVTLGQLYGEFNESTREWTDGLLSSMVRVGANSEDLVKRWYVLDGPVDAVWIENLNTVLDDNKKLCLSSGEIIKLKSTQTMIFEVADLAVASPATVSRCGMIYMDHSVLGIKPILKCWLMHISPLVEPYAERLTSLFDLFLIPAVRFMRSNMQELVPTVDLQIVQSFLNLIDVRLEPLSGQGNKAPLPRKKLKRVDGLLVPWVIFAVIWSVGCTSDIASRRKFSVWLIDRMEALTARPAFPKNSIVYDFALHDGGFVDLAASKKEMVARWVPWLYGAEKFIIQPDTKFSDIEVPTIDTLRHSIVIGMLLSNENNILCVGPTGTGKTLTITQKLTRNMPHNYICEFMMFTARTDANQVQDSLEGRMEQRERGVFGPKYPNKLLFFIDDVNMPALEEYGAQPTIELLRQWIDYGGWYDKKEIGDFRSTVDVGLILAMGLPGGARNPVTARLLRHFHCVAFPEMSDAIKRQIFSTILNPWIAPAALGEKLTVGLMDLTLEVYNQVRRELRPTPAKIHYTFNLRDLSKVVQGMLMVKPEDISSENMLARLWYHENCRVYSDRLINEFDVDQFHALIIQQMKSVFNESYVEAVDNNRNLLFGDIMDANTQAYCEMRDRVVLAEILQEHLDEFNCFNPRPLNIVFFYYAVSHISRIVRILRQPSGNALLLGMTGTGRRTAAMLAIHITELQLCQIKVTTDYTVSDWKDNIKTFMFETVKNARESVFLISDTQVKSETFLEDVNSMLNSGDVPNLYEPADIINIFSAVQKLVIQLGLAPTKTNLLSVYTKMIKTNLHIIVLMSPIGDLFQTRLRQFPALVNCCTIDWFTPWPNEALESVAYNILTEHSEFEQNPVLLRSLGQACYKMHDCVVQSAERYFKELSRRYYVTPAAYLEFLSSYSRLWIKENGKASKKTTELTAGLKKLDETQEEVVILQGQIQKLKPFLLKAAQDTAVVLAKIEKDTVVAERVKQIVLEEEAAAVIKTMQVEEIAADAEKDLEAAMPALQAAQKALEKLRKPDINEVKGMAHPPPGVVFVIEALCVIMDVAPKMIPGPKIGQKVKSYWEPGRTMISASNFLKSLQEFDKTLLTEEKINSIEKYIKDPLFTPAIIQKSSKACMSLCIWVHAMYKFYFIYQAVAPKRAKVDEARSELVKMQETLQAAQKKLSDTEYHLYELSLELDRNMDYKQRMEDENIRCEQCLNRAQQLTEGLYDERVHWSETIKETNFRLAHYPGDLLQCAGAIAYFTPFTDSYRTELKEQFQNILYELEVPHTHNEAFDVIDILGSPVVIRNWQTEGLPQDSFSVENAVLEMNSSRWPLFIDPQGQAVQWIRGLEKLRHLTVCKPSEKGFVDLVEESLRFASPVLVDNVGTELDPDLDPLLELRLCTDDRLIVLKSDRIPYPEDYQIYFITNMPNPNFPPEMFSKVIVINFTLGSSGLQNQLLSMILLQERPDLAETLNELIVTIAWFKDQQEKLEDLILEKLSSSQGSPVDDADLIAALQNSKLACDEIKEKLIIAEETGCEIEGTRLNYKPAAIRGQILYFCLTDLSTIDSMYQYSLDWFVKIVADSLANSPTPNDLDKRVKAIKEHVTFNVYQKVCRSLFEKHRLPFAFLMIVRIFIQDELIDPAEWQHFLAGGLPKLEKENPDPSWITPRAWNELLSLYFLPKFRVIVDTFELYLPIYSKLFESKKPKRDNFPRQVRTHMNDFHILMLMKSVRPDNVMDGVQNFVQKYCGNRFIEPQTTHLSVVYMESSPFIPLIFILSPGTDPASELYKFAEQMKMSQRLLSISLGQGQGVLAEVMFKEGCANGCWVFFQNCHLSPSFMPRLEQLIEGISPTTVHRDFRLWLTSMPSANFPMSILQNGSKMTMEPARGIKANMLQTYAKHVKTNEIIDEYMREDLPNVITFKYLLYALCMFHAITLERRKYGSLGFNIPYEFTDGDFIICVQQLQIFISDSKDAPYTLLNFTAGEINYGGRVTDDWDRRTLMTLVKDFYNSEVCSDDYSYDGYGVYPQLPQNSNLNAFGHHIQGLPLTDDTSIFGLHENADIKYAQAETSECLLTLLSLQPKAISSESSCSSEQTTLDIVESVQQNIPESNINVQLIMEKYPICYDECLNTVLIQEAVRFNKLLSVIRNSLEDVGKALKGTVVMSEALENVSASLYGNSVPKVWSSIAYPSLKPLGAWVVDFATRIQRINEWIDNGIPYAFWMSGFYFPQALITATLQNYARQTRESIDKIVFAFQVLPEFPEARPEVGNVIYGMYLEGARWDVDEFSLAESFPRELYTEMDPILMLPQNVPTKKGDSYKCPVYKTLTRAGNISTTGHSTNFVIAVDLPTSKPEAHWIKRGVAMICALDY